MIVLIVEEYNDANDYVRLLAEAYQDAGHKVMLGIQNFLFTNVVPDIVHVHWPEAIYRWRFKLPFTDQSVRQIAQRLSWYKGMGSKVVYTAHNLLPHEPVDLAFEREVYDVVTANADVIAHHGAASIKLIAKAGCNARHCVVPHGPYEAEDRSWHQARRRYGLPDDKWVILNFGRQRHNKGGGFIGRVFDASNWSGSRLFTIGPRAGGRGGLARRAVVLASSLAKERTVGLLDKPRRRTTIMRNFASSEIPDIMAATDIVFLGHQAGINSGIIPLAISYGKPLVYPDIGNFREQADGWEWAQGYEGGNQASAVEAVLRQRERLADHEPGGTKLDNAVWLANNSWERQVRAIEEATGHTCRSRR